MAKGFEQKQKKRWQGKVSVQRRHDKESAAACNFFTAYYWINGMMRGRR